MEQHLVHRGRRQCSDIFVASRRKYVVIRWSGNRNRHSLLLCLLLGRCDAQFLVPKYRLRRSILVPADMDAFLTQRTGDYVSAVSNINKKPT